MKKESTAMSLVTMMAKACHYAQGHIEDRDAWPSDKDARIYLLQCTSYQMACFFAQNTLEGESGVDWDVIITFLVSKMKSEKEWERILNKIAGELGGWRLSFDKRVIF